MTIRVGSIRETFVTGPLATNVLPFFYLAHTISHVLTNRITLFQSQGRLQSAGNYGNVVAGIRHRP